MADRMYAEISIGGKISVYDLNELVEAVVDQGVYVLDGYGDDGGLDTESAKTYVEESASLNLPIQFYDVEASYGDFDTLRATCEQLGLTYLQRTEGKYDISPHYKFYSPEIGERISLCDGDGNVVVRLYELHELFAEVRKRHSPEYLADAVQQMIDDLELPDVPSLEIVSEY